MLKLERLQQRLQQRPQQRPQQRGQSTVEFALILPLAFVCMVFVLTAGIVVYDHLALADLSRSAVRAAIISDDPVEAASQTAKQVDGDIRVRTTVDEQTGIVRVQLERRRSMPLFVLSRVLPFITVRASAVMMKEPPIVIGQGVGGEAD